MLSKRTDRIADSVRLLAAVGSAAADPTLLSLLKSGPGAYDALKRLAATPPPGVARLADELAAEARALFDATRDLPPDADVLYAQMIEAGLVAAPDIVAAGMDANAVVDAMVDRLTDREHRTAPMLALFRMLTAPALARLLADNAFADDLRAAFMAEVLGRLGDLSARMDHVDRLTRLEMTALADRFEIIGIHALNDGHLREALEKKAAEYRDYRARIEAIDERTAGLGNLKEAALEAAVRLDLDEVEALLARVDAVETEIAAETKALRADNALLRGRVDEAFRLLSAAAESFGSVSQVEPARRRIGFGTPLYDHGLRYGGDGLGSAVQMWRRALDDLHEAAHPVDWAETQNSLGAAMRAQGSRLGGEAGAALLGEAVEAYRAALRVWTEAAHPVDWAGTQNNLGNALQAQGERLGGEAGVALLGEAVMAYGAALRVWTEAAHPVDWARTQNNLGAALSAQGERLGGEAGAMLLGKAVAAYGAALRVRTEAAHPVGWATTTENLGLAHEALAEAGFLPRAALEESAACFEAALRVYHPTSMPYDHGTATASLARVRDRLAQLCA